MNNLLYFIARYHPVFVFLLLEVVSYNLIIRYNTPQQTIHNHSVEVWTSAVDNKVSTIKNYFKLQQIADSLVQENAKLAGALFSIKERLKDASIPRIEDGPTYWLKGARVLSNALFERHNTFTINKGSDDGILPGQGVVTLNGVAGIVKSVGAHYSVVLSLLNPLVRVSAKMKKAPFFGTLRWEGGDLQMADLYDIPKYAEVHKGDSIVTSGFSTIFPPDIPLGMIDRFKIKRGSDVYSIKVRLFTETPTLSYVYVIQRKDREEIIGLQKESQQSDR